MLEAAPIVVDVPAPRAGTVHEARALQLGLAAMRLGAGRARTADAVDHAVGIVLAARPGDVVAEGAPLARVHARTETAAAEAVAEAQAAFRIADGPVDVAPVVVETLA